MPYSLHGVVKFNKVYRRIDLDYFSYLSLSICCWRQTMGWTGLWSDLADVKTLHGFDIAVSMHLAITGATTEQLCLPAQSIPGTCSQHMATGQALHLSAPLVKTVCKQSAD